MFKDKFNEEMQNIRPSAVSKSELLDEMKKEKERLIPVRPKKSTKKRWITAIAAAVAVVIVSVTAFNLPIFGGNNMIDGAGSEGESSKTASVDEKIEFPVIEHQTGIPANVSYSQVYKLFSAIYQTEQKKYTGTEGYEYEIIEQAETAYEETIEEYADDGAMPGGMGGEVGSTKDVNTTAKPDGATEEDYSTTNTQVEDVDEADIVKTDGKYIYALNVKELKINIAKAEKGKLEAVSTIYLSVASGTDQKHFGDASGTNQKYLYASEMYVSLGRLVIIYEYYSDKDYSVAKIFDITSPENPTVVREISQSGSYLSSRVIGNKLYFFTNEYIYQKPNENDKCSYVPCTSIDGGAPTPIDDSCIYMFDGEINRSYLTALSVDITTGTVVDSKTALGGGSDLYANTKSIYVTADKSNYSYAEAAGTPTLATKYENATRIMRFAINGGKISAVAEGVVSGTPLNQFSMDEYKGYFRIVTTGYYSYTTSNAVYVLDGELKQVGAIEDIAKDERVYSVRFMGDIGYFVTFRETDPLFAVDLSNPKEPKILSALKIPGFSNYLHPWDDGLLLGIGQEADENTGAIQGFKLSMFDISDPENVTEKHKKAEYYIDGTVGTQHKAVLVSKEKNIIAFPVKGAKYYVYGYSAKNGFESKAILDAQTIEEMFYYTDCTRGIYIGDFLYVCNYNGIISYSLSDFKKIDNLIF